MIPLDGGWRFVQDDVNGAQSPETDDSAWRPIDLPHDWGIEGEYRQDHPAGGVGAYFPGGIGWYRRVIDVVPEWVGKRVFIEFDAAQRNSDVWINGHHLGHRPYGYISFGYDLSPHLKPGRNVLAVRLDNSKLPAARWYTGSGIYSHVRLIVTDQVHVPPSGTFVTTPHASPERGEAEVATDVVNASADRAVVVLSSQMLDGDGNEVASSSARAEVAPGARETIRTAGLNVARPKRWSPESPYLYRLVQQLTRGDDQVVDEVTTHVGFRTTRFDADTGFWLNGQNIS
ncbi:MAG: hypothetical protein M3478_03765 [Planctomycetota bacterium]|nr:hypothetical protein [Planctomycetota bacterium]